MKKPTVKVKAKATVKKKRSETEAVLMPSEIEYNRKCDLFIEKLRTGDGNISRALRDSGLPRNSAYDRYRRDPDFAAQWVEAIEDVGDGLMSEAIKRGKEGSDTLLIFAIKQHEYKKKWRQRIIATGQAAIDAVEDRGRTLGLSPEQIQDLQLTMTKEFEKISLI